MRRRGRGPRSWPSGLDDGLHVRGGHPGVVVSEGGLAVQGHAQGRGVDAAGARGRLAAGLAGLRVAAVLAVALLAVAVLAVGLDVLGQVVGPHEPLVADGAGEPLLAGVGPKVALQLVGPGEPLAAEEPVADEGPLAGVPPQVGLQVGRFPVDLAAARDVTAVNVALAEVGSGRAEPLGLLAVGTVARGAARVAPGRPLGGRERGGRGRGGRGEVERAGVRGRQHGLVGVLEQVLSAAQELVGQAQRVVGRRVGGHLLRRVHRGRGL